jgi:hypothetical protein
VLEVEVADHDVEVVVPPRATILAREIEQRLLATLQACSACVAGVSGRHLASPRAAMVHFRQQYTAWGWTTTRSQFRHSGMTLAGAASPPAQKRSSHAGATLT